MSGGAADLIAFIGTVVSCVSSFFVLISFSLFPRLWNRLFMQIVLYISLSDFIANACLFSGGPSNDYLCFFQGFFQQFFYPASWLWTTLLMYLLYCLVRYGKIVLKRHYMHLICWGLPLLFTLLPLTTETYSNGPEHVGLCWIETRSSNNSSIQLTVVWRLLTWELPIFFCSFLMLSWALLIYRMLLMENIPCPKAVQTALKALFAYPLFLMICWLPIAISNNICENCLAPGSIMETMLFMLTVQQGTFTAIAFFYNSLEVRRHWYTLLVQAGIVCVITSKDESSGTEITNCFCCGKECQLKQQYIDGDNDSVFLTRRILSGGNASAATKTSGSQTASTLGRLLTLPSYELEDDDAYFGKKPFNNDGDETGEWRVDPTNTTVQMRTTSVSHDIVA